MSAPAPTQPHVHTWTRDDYYRMAEIGLLPDRNVELIEGQVFDMSPIGSWHAYSVTEIDRLFQAQLEPTFVVRVQNPVYFDEQTEPQPDLAVLKPPARRYARTHPRPADILLIVEVADTSIELDRSRKVPLYARFDIPEVWLVDLKQDAVEVYTQPASGQYQNTRVARRGETLTSIRLPALAVPVHATLAADD